LHRPKLGERRRNLEKGEIDELVRDAIIPGQAAGSWYFFVLSIPSASGGCL
jgi:hypothetical protein